MGEDSGGGRTMADSPLNKKEASHKGTKTQRGEDFRQDYRMGEDEQDGIAG